MDSSKGFDQVDVLTAARLSGLSRHMVTYLERNGITLPRGRVPGRGRARTYAVGDVVVLGLVATLLSRGVEVARLATPLRSIAEAAAAWSGPVGPRSFAVTDGDTVDVIRKGRGGVMPVPPSFGIALLVDLDALFEAVKGDWPN